MASCADPHVASALAVIGPLTVCSSILPWRAANGPTWPGENQGARTEATVRDVEGALGSGDVVWGGDWNHAVHGTETSGSARGAAAIRGLLERRGLQLATRGLPHRIGGLLTIDHIAVPDTWQITDVRRVGAAGFSDHDAYTVDVTVC
jgi:hypothetical protein